MPLSGQKTVTTAGSAVILGSQLINGSLLIKALDTNTGIIAVGNDGSEDVTVSNGLRLAAGDEIYLNFIGNLSSLMIDASVNGEGISWLMLEV